MGFVIVVVVVVIIGHVAGTRNPYHCQYPRLNRRNISSKTFPEKYASKVSKALRCGSRSHHAIIVSKSCPTPSVPSSHIAKESLAAATRPDAAISVYVAL